MPFPAFDRSRLRLQPLGRRQHDLDLSVLLPLDAPLPPFEQPAIGTLGQRLGAARQAGTARLLLMGAHVLRAGVSRHLIDLMERGLINHIAMNGAGPIHDWEFALIGATTESVARYIRSGEFGLWEETGRMNDAIRQAARGRPRPGRRRWAGRSWRGSFPHKDVVRPGRGACGWGCRSRSTSASATTSSTSTPTATGRLWAKPATATSLSSPRRVTKLEGGVMLNFGSAVMGPEVYLKALAMARNVAHQEGRSISKFTTAVFDLIPLDGDTRQQAPKSDPRYYYRPWKTILVRTVADGGESFYIQGDHRRHGARICTTPLSRLMIMLTDELIEHILSRLPQLDHRRARRPVPRPLPRHRRGADRAIDRDGTGRVSGGAACGRIPERRGR